MAQDTDKIKIKTANTQGGGNDGNDLKNCYFLPTNQTGKYVFFDSTGTPIVTSLMPIPVPLPANTQFTFQLPGNSFTWWIPNPAAGSEAFSITGTGSTATTSGSWANNDGSQLTESVGSDPTGESGTFQGQAGQDPEAEDAAYAAKT
ncbi:MAG TPA: hypothetical protein VLB46_19540 [Pyrinomonadaceae bacterium]|nr:hypothetical protein [Pyrinomonadaceae bacterium]